MKTKSMNLTFNRRTVVFLAAMSTLCLVAFKGCDNHAVDPDGQIQGKIEDATGIVYGKKEGSQPPLYIVVPDFDPKTIFALTGIFLPPNNLPKEFEGEGIRVVFSGMIVEVPPEYRLAAIPLKLTSINRTDMIKDANGIIKRLAGFQPPLYVVTPDFNTATGFALNGALLPPDNLPDEFKQDGLKVSFSGVIVPIPPELRMVAGPLKLSSIKKIE